jgi:hypothetical protein
MTEHVVTETLPVMLNCSNEIVLSESFVELFRKRGLDKLLTRLSLSGVAY